MTFRRKPHESNVRPIHAPNKYLGFWDPKRRQNALLGFNAKALSSPAFKTRLAAGLAKLAPDDLAQLSRANPGIVAKLKMTFPDIQFPGDAIVDGVTKSLLGRR